MRSESDLAQEPGATAAHSPGSIAPTADELAQQFPRLEVLELLGQGGMGIVYKARQPQLDRFVALKILPAGVGRDRAFAGRFAREARALAKLTHPSIVTVYDFGASDGQFYLLMEFVDGVNLRHLLRERRLKPEEALKVVPQICEALEYAHEQGVIHRDIKPENILLDKRGRAKIADFGLAKLLGSKPADSALTGSQQIMGTPQYMAPEQMERPTAVDHRADIYSLGVVFYEMLTGELPLGRFSPPSQKVHVDVRLDEVVLRALEKEPERRYQHAIDVKTDVESISPGPEPAIVGSDHVRTGSCWRLLILVAVGYGLSFVLPAYRFYTGWDRGPNDRGYVSADENSLGWRCFRAAWEMQSTCWYANPVLWVACILLVLRKWLWAGLVALVALGLGLSVWDPFSQSRFLFGFWLWLASMAALASGSLYEGWKLRNGSTNHPTWWMRI
jgi:predicted Ser/Thr protein kinase